MNTDRRIVAFLQNQWFDRPLIVERAYAAHAGDIFRQCRLTEAYLFMGCLSGRRLQAAFADLRDQIAWANASPKIGSKSSDTFEPDPQHMAKIVQHFKPEIVIGFGKLAQEGILKMLPLMPAGTHFSVCSAPHPAAHHDTVANELAAVAADVRARIRGAA